MSQIASIIQESINVKQSILLDEKMILKIDTLIDIITAAFKNGNKVLFCGNGGSAADAQHLAAEFSGRFYKDRKALPAEALHCNTSYLTAVGNDYGFDQVYARMIEGIGQEGDVLFAISTSGNSPNIVNAIVQAKTNKMITIAMTGNLGGRLKLSADHIINVPSEDTPRVQEAHILIGHIICQLVEERYFELGK